MQAKNRHSEKVRIARTLVGGHLGFTLQGNKVKISIFNNNIWKQRRFDIALSVARRQGRLPEEANK